MSLALEKTDLARHVSIWQKQGKLLWVEGPTLQAGVDDMGGCERRGRGGGRASLQAAVGGDNG